ncbi:NADH:ubiquinone oxidoreductase subunit 4 (subunit M) [Anoxybacillus voinovskiensis]|uniref:NADH:ubiquinone oxidoreductase subunit 4 (Subunit M) n=1 Tax=Anoxybacteroides voinovskiense TaxID=230470 RepID=A0A840DM10_9BACL|nr:MULTISPECIES: hypothetical protein [Anoxybacillus]MBB4073930.1 NADH:ubiquinone oxidoreductase subunit 4 (subunit M) [Anoxybacillus voinovskiensis]MCL6586974.1 hypothetical protein [Anoxybacillus sp.]GGJ66052.1 hypothetical protein GCM10008982_14130 [Anoxybacillus voinovskiensis]
MTALFVSAVLGVVLTAASLYVKAAIERRFYRRKKIPSLHAVNVLAIGGVIASVYYSLANMSLHGKQLFYVYFGAIELLLPLYVLFGIWFARYEKKEKKYTTSADKKVLYIKQKYLTHRRHDHYHSKTS